MFQVEIVFRNKKLNRLIFWEEQVMNDKKSGGGDIDFARYLHMSFVPNANFSDIPLLCPDLKNKIVIGY